MLTMKIETKILGFGKLPKTTVVSMGTKSYNQLEFLNLVTMATNTRKNVDLTLMKK